MLGLALGLSLVPGPTGAGNWGAGDSSMQVLCLNQLDDEEWWESQCTANDANHYVYFTPSVPDNLRTALTNSVEDDYNPIFGF